MEGITVSHEQLGWLRCLIVAYETEHRWAQDEDPSATREMLSQCRALANDLGEWLPPDEPRDIATLPVGDEELPY